MPDLPFLAPGRIGPLRTKSRLVRAPTSETMATPAGHVTDDLVRLYDNLGQGGAAVVMTGHLFVEARGQYAPFQTGIHEDACVAGLTRLAEAVHRGGALAFAELAHAGSQSIMPEVTPIAASVVPNAIYDREPREMTEEDIADVIAAFAAGARRAMAAGFDGIHIHSGNGYLLSAFNSPLTNLRTDAWGGDAERRSHLLTEVYRAARGVVGDAVPVTMRLGMADAVPRGLELDESLDRLALLAAEGLDAVEPTYGVMGSYKDNIRPYAGVTFARALADWLPHRLFARPVAEAYYRPFARAVKARLDLPVILVGGMRSAATIADVIASGDADFISMARPFVREPDLPRRLAAGTTGMAACVSCNLCLAYEGTLPLKCWRLSAGSLLEHARRKYLGHEPGHG